MPRHRIATVALTLALAAGWIGDAAAQQPANRLKVFSGAQNQKNTRDTPALLEADHMTYDQELGVVTAEGRVEITQGERMLTADKVSWYERDGRVTATGNVVLVEPTGEVAFADYAELQEEMKNGVIRRLRMLLSDNSRLVASGGQRSDGNRTVIDNVTYTPCNTCREDRSRPPLWQIKAKRAIHDQANKIVEYEDATMELWGVPVAYAPRFSHPDPSVKRQEGLLPPSPTHSTYFGMSYQQGYYLPIDESTDVTVTPRITTKRGAQMAAEFRQRTQTGEYWMDGSATFVEKYDDNNNDTGDKYWRGHIRGAGRFELDDKTRYGFNVFRATDSTYANLYGISTLNTLTSRAFVERQDGRSFGSINAYSFQNLRPNADQGISPIIGPFAAYNYVGEPDKFGGQVGADVSYLSLYRTRGTQTQRASVTPYWKLPYYGPMGDVYTLQVQMRGDGYWSDQTVGGGTPTTVNTYGFAGRAMPLAMLDWRWPFVRPGTDVNLLVEPIVNFIATPNGGNSSKIPNEDSQTYEFDETNLFSVSRFPGLDRYDGSPRVNYGVRAGAYSVGGGFTEFIVGQSARTVENTAFAPGSGLRDQISDIVGRITVAPTPYLNISNRIRYNPHQRTMERYEVMASAGTAALNGGVTYARLNKSLFTSLTGDQEAIGLTGSARLTRNWTVNGTYLTDLTGGGTLRTFGGLRYTDECFDIMFFVDRNNTVDRDIRPSTTYGVRFIMVNLG